MVNVAVAGGSGQVAREVIDALESPNTTIAPGVRWQTVDYGDKAGLIDALQGIHTLLSFVQLLSDPDQASQKNLIDAAISSGVKRFAPSEYGREYLRQVNKNENKLQYTLFQPGLFLDYLAFPYKTAKYFDPLQTIFDFEHRRAIVMEGHEDAIMTLTTVADLAAVVARAVDYDSRWPETGGIRGNRITFSQLLEVGKRVRGRSFDVEKVKVEDLEAGRLETSWGLEAVHQAVSKEEASTLLKAVSIGILLSSSKGAWDSSDELNQLFPDYEFTPVEDFLAKAWEGKP
ncbi:hypothetical protein SLS62_009114 [Diatrype stigma]|uniref:NmrA-like domain-containing protein n=1 Tax=Diatrype stigma TaxID=117547 RepID=A0AAN9UG91_9PEZI